MKNSKINELNESIDALKTYVDRWKIKLESEKKTSMDNSDKLKYLTQSIRRKKDANIQEKSYFDREEKLAIENFKEKRKYIEKSYKSCNNLD